MKTSTSRPQMGSSLFAGCLLSPLWTECSPPGVMCEWLMHSRIALHSEDEGKKGAALREVVEVKSIVPYIVCWWMR